MKLVSPTNNFRKTTPLIFGQHKLPRPRSTHTSCGRATGGSRPQYLHRIGRRPTTTCPGCANFGCPAARCLVCDEEADTPRHVTLRCPCLGGASLHALGCIFGQPSDLRRDDVVAALAAGFPLVPEPFGYAPALAGDGGRNNNQQQQQMDSSKLQFYFLHTRATCTGKQITSDQTYKAHAPAVAHTHTCTQMHTYTNKVVLANRIRHHSELVPSLLVAPRRKLHMLPVGLVHALGSTFCSHFCTDEMQLHPHETSDHWLQPVPIA